MKKFMTMLKKSYITAEMDAVAYETLIEYLEEQGINYDILDRKVVPGTYRRSGEDYTGIDKLSAEANAGEYDLIAVFLNSKDETDAWREKAYDRDDPFALKSMQERIIDETYHVRDDRIQTVATLDKNVDGWNYWFVSQISPDVDVIHVDMNEGVPYAYSVTEEYYAPVHHDKDDMTDEAKEWARVLGYEGDVRDYMDWFLETFPTTEERLEFVNGMNKDELGQTSDKQVVICPECGGLTFAAPAMQAYVDPQAKVVPFESAAQMTCEHCGASLASSFGFAEPEAEPAYREPIENYTPWWTDPDYKIVHLVKHNK